MTAVNDKFLTEMSSDSVINLILIFVLTGVAIVLCIWACRKIRTEMHGNFGFLRTIMAIGIVVCIALSIKYVLDYVKTVKDLEEYGQKRTKYTVYVDGMRTDYDKVCLSAYDVEYNDELKEIYLAPKQPRK